MSLETEQTRFVEATRSFPVVLCRLRLAILTSLPSVTLERVQPNALRPL